MPAERFIPALGLDALTPLYDPVARLLGRERRLKRQLLAQAAPRAGERVLDLGCGTGTLAILVARARPEALALGLDRDPRILLIARRKIERAGLRLPLLQGNAARLPFADESLDRVLVSWVFHHLSDDEKRRALGEIRRCLRPGGELHVADWGRPQNLLMSLCSLLMVLLEDRPRVRVHLRGRFPELVRAERFEQVEETGHRMTAAGTVAFLRARRPVLEDGSKGAA